MGECCLWRHSTGRHSRELIQSRRNQAVTPGGKAREHEIGCHEARWQILLRPLTTIKWDIRKERVPLQGSERSFRPLLRKV